MIEAAPLWGGLNLMEVTLFVYAKGKTEDSETKSVESPHATASPDRAVAERPLFAPA